MDGDRRSPVGIVELAHPAERVAMRAGESAAGIGHGVEQTKGPVGVRRDPLGRVDHRHRAAQRILLGDRHLPERIADLHLGALVGREHREPPGRDVLHLAAQRIEGVLVEEQRALLRVLTHRHRAARHMLAQRIEHDLLHQPRRSAGRVVRLGPVPPPADRAAPAVQLHRVVGAARRGAPLHHPPGVVLRPAVLRARQGDRRLRPVVALLQREAPEAVMGPGGHELVGVGLLDEHAEAGIVLHRRDVTCAVGERGRVDALRLVGRAGGPMVPEGIVGGDARDVAEGIARVDRGELRLGAPVVALGALALHLAEDRRGAGERAALGERRGGAALLLGLELPDHPAIGVVLEAALDVEVEIDADDGDVFVEDLAEEIEVGDVDGHVAQQGRADARLDLGDVGLDGAVDHALRASHPAMGRERRSRSRARSWERPSW